MSRPCIRRLSSTLLPANAWHVRSWLLILGVTLLFSGHWVRLPMYLDVYYHLSVMQALLRAGGIVLNDVWEYAPVGRPHVYPPLLHVLLTVPGRWGWDPLAIGRMLQWLSVPLMCGGVWWFAARRSSPRQGFFTLVAALASFSFLLTAVDTLAATLALLELMAWYLSVERGRLLSSILWCALLWYTHLGLPWLAAAGMIVYGLWRPELRRVILISIVGGCALGSPWLWHLWRCRAFIVPQSTYGNTLLELSAALWVLGLIGGVVAWRRGGRDRAPVAMLLGLLPMLWQYRRRFLCGQGLLPVILLAGLGCEWLCQQSSGRGRVVRIGVPLALTLILWCAPTWTTDPGGTSWSWCESAPCALWPRLEKFPGLSVYHPRVTPEVIDGIRRWSAPDELLASNQDNTLALFAVAADRAVSSAMFKEVRPWRPHDPYREAHLIVWFKHPEHNPEPALLAAMQRYGWVMHDESTLAYFLRNPSASHARPAPSRPVVPLPVAWCLAFGALGLAAWDMAPAGGEKNSLTSSASTAILQQTNGYK